MHLTELLNRLEGVKGSGGRYVAKCPTHADQKPSLSISLGDDGKILLHCHAGCKTEDIATALGLSMKDLFADITPGEAFPAYRPMGQRDRPPVVATYTYPSGAQKLRRADKSFLWRQPDGKGGWTWGRKGVPNELYVAGELRGSVFASEGEKDADSLHALGFPAVSGADGAGPGKWRKEYTTQLQGLHVCVFQDNDEVGKDYAAETCNALHGVAASVRLLDLSKVWPEVPEHGDVSDLIATLGPVSASEQIARLVTETAEWVPTGKPVVENPLTETVCPPDFSDAGNAAVFTRTYQNNLIFVDALGWLWWTGKRWERDEHKATALALELSDQMLKEARKANREALHQVADAQAKYAESGEAKDEESKKAAERAAKDAKSYLSHAQNSRNAIRIKNMLELSKPALVVKADKLDANPFDLNTPAGIVNLTTGQLRPHDRTAYCSQMTQAAPNSNGADMWGAFLDTITCNDGSIRGFLQLVAGMALIGSVYQEGIVIAYGGGRNGKSTVFNAIGQALGDYTGSIDIKTITTDRANKGASLATLRGKRLVITGELEEHQRLSVATLKQLASTDKLVIEEKFKQPETVTQTHTLVLFTNHLPRVGSTDGGTWRRLIVVPFNATIPAGTGVQNYADVLVKKAGEAILSWAIEGAVNFVRNGFRLDVPDVVAEATEAYREREDWLNNFISERCIREPNAREGARALYLEYKAWAQDAGDYVRRESDFSTAMETAGYCKMQPKGKFTYMGIRVDRSKVFQNPYAAIG